MREIEPTVITKGERLAWTKSYSDFSATLYTLEYRFRGIITGGGFNVTASADGENFNAEITAAQSETMTAGKYEWQAWLTEIADATNTFLAPGGGGRITVKPGFTSGSTTSVDTRSTAKKILDEIDAAILASTDALSGVIEYDISTPSGRKKVVRSRDELFKMRETYVKIVRRENLRDRVANGGQLMTPVNVRINQ